MECWTVNVSLSEPLHLGDIEVSSREFAFLRIESGGGDSGVAYAMTRGAPVVDVLADLVWPNVVGKDALNISSIRDCLDRALVTHGRAGTVQRAVSLVDIALWDLKGKLTELPVWKLLGGGAERTAPLMVVADYCRSGEAPDRYADRVAAYLADGYEAVKLYPAANAIKTREQIVAVRRAFDRQADRPDPKLVLDVAWMWRSLRTAVDDISRWEDLDLAWVEDPLPADMVRVIGELSKRVETPIAAGDELSVPALAFQLLDEGAVDILRVDATTLGGISTSADLLRTAASRMIPVSTHIYPEIHRHLSLAFPDVVLMLERFPPQAATWGADQFLATTTGVLPDRQLSGLAAPDAPGLDLEIDWKLVRAKSKHFRSS